MIFEKKENGIRHLKMNNWSLTLKPVDTETKNGFTARYYENGREELKIIVSSNYDCILCEEKNPKNDAIIYKIIAFFDVFKRMDELEEFEKNLNKH